MLDLKKYEIISDIFFLRCLILFSVSDIRITETFILPQSEYAKCEIKSDRFLNLYTYSDAV